MVFGVDLIRWKSFGNWWFMFWSFWGSGGSGDVVVFGVIKLRCFIFVWKVVLLFGIVIIGCFCYSLYVFFLFS